MAVTVQWRINQAAVATVVGPMIDRAAYRAAQKMRGRAIANIQRLGRIDTGAMVGRMQVRKAPSASATTARYTVSSTVPYAKFQEVGVRPFGPRRARFLVFTPKGGGGVVFAKRVRGFPGGHFLRDALAQARPSDAAL